MMDFHFWEFRHPCDVGIGSGEFLGTLVGSASLVSMPSQRLFRRDLKSKFATLVTSKRDLKSNSREIKSLHCLKVFFVS